MKCENWTPPSPDQFNIIYKIEVIIDGIFNPVVLKVSNYQ